MKHRQIIFTLLAVPFVHQVLAERVPLKIIPSENGWKGAGIRDVQKLLTSTANELWKYAYDQELKPIVVNNSSGGPIVYFKRGRNGEFRVKLDTGGTYWSQYAFQFSHEFCHILCHYKEADKTNLWFEETLCECASLFTLRAMSRSWEQNPPYPNWKNYRHSLYNYAQDRINAHKLGRGLSLKTWYAKHADHLKNHATDRPKNTTMAIELLPLFEKNPEAWAAVSFINKGRGKETQSFKTYLDNWANNCPAEYRVVVLEIQNMFGL